MTNPGSGPVGQLVADGVGWIPGGFVNMFAFQEGQEIFLIDTGLSRRPKAVLRAFEQAKAPLSRVGKILLTHHHDDHRGGAAYLHDAAHAPVECHADDAPYVDGRARVRVPLLLRLFLHARPAPVATELREGDRVGSLQVVHVPGHTPGEVAFYHPSRKILFSGDSVVERQGKLTLPGVKFASNLEQAVRSLDRLRSLDVEVLLPGHGVPVTKDVASLLDDLIRRAPAEFLPRP